MAVPVLVLLIAAGCGSAGRQDPSSSAGPSTITEAYRAAHPTGNLPETLSTVEATLPGLAEELRASVTEGVPVVLPEALPQGLGLAAPFISIGNGSALPNPEVWDGGYRVAFTDGERLVTVAVNQIPLPGSGPWTTTTDRALGRDLRSRTDGQSLVLATETAGDWQVALVGIGFPPGWLGEFAASLEIAD